MSAKSGHRAIVKGNVADRNRLRNLQRQLPTHSRSSTCHRRVIRERKRYDASEWRAPGVLRTVSAESRRDPAIPGTTNSVARVGTNAGRRGQPDSPAGSALVYRTRLTTDRQQRSKRLGWPRGSVNKSSDSFRRLDSEAAAQLTASQSSTRARLESFTRGPDHQANCARQRTAAVRSSANSEVAVSQSPPVAFLSGPIEERPGPTREF